MAVACWLRTTEISGFADSFPDCLTDEALTFSLKQNFEPYSVMRFKAQRGKRECYARFLILKHPSRSLPSVIDVNASFIKLTSHNGTVLQWSSTHVFSTHAKSPKGQDVGCKKPDITN